MKNKKIILIQLGGTISSQSNNPSDEFYGSPELNIFNLIPTLGLNSIEIIEKNFARKISHEILIEEIQDLAITINELARTDVDGIVVCMGTNAIEDTAYFMGLLVNTCKPIVFTGSNYPQGSLCFDGKLNLYNAITLAASEQAVGLGVLITFNGYVLSARDICKQSPGFLDNFNSDSFARLGEISDGKFKLRAIPTYRHTHKSEFHIKTKFKYPKICIIYGHLGMDINLMEALFNTGVEGVVSAGFGKGHQNTPVTQALHKLVLKGAVVVRCPRLSYCYTNLDQNYDNKYGFINSNGLSPQKCSILLATAIAFEKQREDLPRIFEEY